MVPAHSHKVSRVSWYSGSCHARLPFVYGAFTLSGWLSQNHSTRLTRQSCSPNPGVHALRFGLFRVRSPLLTESHVVFSSSGYLDVSVHRVPFHSLWIGLWILEVFSSRFPHSDISGSQDICSSPKLFAAYHVFHRLLVPRHPPYALSSMTSSPREVRVCLLPLHMPSVACAGFSGNTRRAANAWQDVFSIRCLEYRLMLLTLPRMS